ncbi:MAG: hypothetical protein M9905_10890 [Rhizobiaceae bacterium]|nr:hypothetical protein [Rhizobiaceae bacterium]
MRRLAQTGALVGHARLHREERPACRRAGGRAQQFRRGPGLLAMTGWDWPIWTVIALLPVGAVLLVA